MLINTNIQTECQNLTHQIISVGFLETFFSVSSEVKHPQAFVLINP